MTTATPHHHPLPECLLAYANGGIGEAESLFIATHLAFCPTCRNTAQIGECVGSRILCETAATPVSSACRDKIFAALETMPAELQPAPATPTTPECFIPEPLRGYLGGIGCRGGVQQLAWESVATGQSEYPVPLSKCCLQRGAAVRLVALQPQHDFVLQSSSHRPVLQVLCGELHTTDQVFVAGDVLCGNLPALHSGGYLCYALLLLNPPPAPWQSWMKRLFSGTR